MNKSRSLILVYMIHLPTVHVCTKFQSSRPHSSREKSDGKILMFERSSESSRPHSSREKCDEKFQCLKLERKKNEEIRG